MDNELPFYVNIPVTEREKLREKLMLRTYREVVENLTALDANTQMDAESDYLIQENRLLYKRLTSGDTKLLDITPDNYRMLGELAKHMAGEFRKDVTVMKYDDLMRGYEYYQQNPPVPKFRRVPLEVEHLIVGMAADHPTWGSPHILHAMRNVGYLNLKPHHVRSVLSKNHIPVIKRRMRKGVSWKNFAAILKYFTNTGVIAK